MLIYSGVVHHPIRPHVPSDPAECHVWPRLGRLDVPAGSANILVDMRAQKRTIALAILVTVLTLVLLVGYTLYSLRAFRGLGIGSQIAEASVPDKVTGTTADVFFSQTIHWGGCSPEDISSSTDQPANMSSYECAHLFAPLDWENPAGEQIELALAVHRSGKKEAPVLFYNLGGPGGAAVSSIVSQVEDGLGTSLVKNYDIVALDPRGVGASTPVHCLSNEQLDRYNSEGSILPDVPDRADQSPEEIVASMTAELSTIAAGCEKLSGSLYRHIDTVSAAKDFEMVRRILHQEKFDYLGYSYGTFLGATYAQLYPNAVGRMVLDGAVDPAMNLNDISDLQIRGFEESISHWIDGCLAEDECGLKGPKQAATTQLVNFLNDLEDQPMETSDKTRPLTKNLAITAIVGSLYWEGGYDTLSDAMAVALGAEDGSALLFLADYYNDRNDDGTYVKNSTEALIAVNNLDYAPFGTLEEWAQAADQLAKELPVLGPTAGYASAGLNAWPTPHATREAIRASGAAPILVIGTTHDPATPYVMAENLAKELDSGVLVTNEGWGHTAYAKDANSCVVGAVESYFLNGTVPAEGTRCAG